MEDGKTIEVYVKSWKTQKGLIEEIKVRDQNDKKVKIDPEKIKYMYLPQRGLGKLADNLSFLNDATQWDNEDINSDLIQDGYIYFEKTEVQIKKKKTTAMLQLLNPSFCSKIKVYDDPYAVETRGIGIGGINVTETYAKSHYVKVGDKISVKVEKKDYDEEFGKLFSGCSAVKTAFGADIKWKDFAPAVHAAGECK